MNSQLPGAAYNPAADWTAAPTLLSPPGLDSPPALQRQSPTSFSVVQSSSQHLSALAHWLIDEHSYQMTAARSRYELARLRTRAGSLVVIYLSGSVLVQGIQVAQATALLDQLVSEEQPEVVQGVLL